MLRNSDHGTLTTHLARWIAGHGDDQLVGASFDHKKR
jgi:hypothetical protein